jgi:hypothetical protein
VAFNVVEPPTQNEALVAAAVMVGAGFTTTEVVAVLEHPVAASVPVTVYVVVVVGLTVTEAPFKLPGFQL